MNENIEKLALEYVEKDHYSHVYVEDDWYALTSEYKAFKAGYEAAIKEVEEYSKTKEFQDMKEKAWMYDQLAK